jgi:predicted transcriptional regulator
MDYMFELYEQVKDDMKFFIASDVRAKILISLISGSKNLADLRKEIHLSSSTILHGMNQLEQKNFIFRESGNYSLSQTGEVVANKLIDVMRSFYSLNLCEGLFLNHDISCIPPELFKDIGCLEKSFIVKSTSTNIMRPQEVLSEFLSKSENFKQLTSVYNPSSIQIFLETLEKDGNVQLIMTEGIIDKLVENVGKDKLENWVNEGKLQLMKVDEDVNISLTTGDNFIALGLFSADGAYDLNISLISHGEEAISWGNRLFDHYLQQSTPVKMGSLEMREEMLTIEK